MIEPFLITICFVVIAITTLVSLYTRKSSIQSRIRHLDFSFPEYYLQMVSEGRIRRATWRQCHTKDRVARQAR